LGQAIYPRFHFWFGDHAGKIVGMLLALPRDQLLPLLANAKVFASNIYVHIYVCVLENFNSPSLFLFCFNSLIIVAFVMNHNIYTGAEGSRVVGYGGDQGTPKLSIKREAKRSKECV
jgi:hypothetical protein